MNRVYEDGERIWDTWREAFSDKGKLRPDDEELRLLKKKMPYYTKGWLCQKSYMHLHKAHEIRYKFIYDNSSKFHVEKMCIVLEIKLKTSYKHHHSVRVSQHMKN